jgi:integrator complex subunit 6
MNLLLHDQQHPPSSNYPQQQNPSLHLYLNSNTTLENSTNNHQPPILTLPLVSTPVVTCSIPSPTSPTAPIVTVATTPTITTRVHHNDMNDASNISKILQSSITNGSGSNSSISTNNNLVTSSSSDKRSHDSIKYYQREDSMKSTTESSKSIGRSKKKEPKTPTKLEKVVNSNNQHKHVNGSSDAKLTNNSNHHQNGDEIYSEEDIKKWEIANQETRILVFREIRKFGRDYGGLFKELEKVKGNYELQNSFVQTCINECLRFKRKAMATSIEDWWEKRHICRNNGQATGKLKI